MKIRYYCSICGKRLFNGKLKKCADHLNGCENLVCPECRIPNHPYMSLYTAYYCPECI